jgi:hypothetical protein
MTNLLHRLTHRIPGVPTHTDQPPGHPSLPNRRHHHAHTRPPRFLPSWQRRIAALVSRGR